MTSGSPVLPHRIVPHWLLTIVQEQSGHSAQCPTQVHITALCTVLYTLCVPTQPVTVVPPTGGGNHGIYICLRPDQWPVFIKTKRFRQIGRQKTSLLVLVNKTCEMAWPFMPFRSGSIPSLFPINELLQATLLGFHLAKAAKAALFLSCIGTAVYTIIYHIYIYIYI